MLCDAGYKPVIFAEIWLPKPPQNIQFVHVFSFGVYFKALIGFKAFYFFSSVLVRFQCICEMALRDQTAYHSGYFMNYNPFQYLFNKYSGN